jgi:hypothetical protein
MLFGLIKKHASMNVPWISEETKPAGMFCGLVREGASMNVPLISEKTKPAGMFCFFCEGTIQENAARNVPRIFGGPCKNK